jgi:glycosyltransferase involved in cell wall biosynthesis
MILGMEKSSTFMQISTIIPVSNGGEHFRRCLQSLAEAHPGEVIVVANGDSDGSRDAARAFGAQVLTLPDAVGPARARNLGAQSAKGEIVFFIDADVAVHPDVFTRIETALKQQPDTAAIIGSYDDAPGTSNFLSQYKNLLHHFVHQQSNEEASTFWGACGAIRRDVFLALGGFDESYRRPCVEDIELGYRLKRAGYRIRLVKTLQVKHLKRWTALSLVKSDFFDRALPWTTLIWRDKAFISDLNLQQSSRVSVVVSYGIVAALMGAVMMPPLVLVAAALVLALVGLNAPVYRFFQRKRGWVFALRVLPWHGLYYLYSGLAFALGTARFHMSAR